MSKHTLYDLQELQALPLQLKIQLTKQRIREWVSYFGQDGVYVSFSGGKDSTVLLHLVREDYPDVPAVFCNTGLEYPEIVQFVKSFENVEIIRPKKNFRRVIQDYGYPFISKEVSECAYGARKYLTKVLAEQDALATDRQTDSKWGKQCIRRLCGYGEYAKPNSGGGWTVSTENSVDWASLPNSQKTELLQETLNNADKKKIGGGGIPWRLAALTGVLTTDNCVDIRLQKNNRQRPDTKDAEHSSNTKEEKSDSGDYP